MNDSECTIEITSQEINSSFVKEIIEKSDSNIRLCYQCHKCTAGCPIADFAMDDNPSLIIHFIRLGLKERVLNSNSIWICASCKVCTTRCPQGIDIAKVMEEARRIAIREGKSPKEKSTVTFYEIMFKNVLWLGRVYEPMLIGLLKLKTGDFTKDLQLGWDLFRKGKLLPWKIPLGGDAKDLRRIISRIEEEGK